MTKTMTKEALKAMKTADALDRLKEGNERFRTGDRIVRDLSAEREATVGDQAPFAVIVSCLDSRTSSELIFDLGIGDVFNARIAGNLVNEDIIGSMEFACAAKGSKLIVVLGHTSCGAINGACGGGGTGLANLDGLLDKLKPAVEAVKAEGGDATNIDEVARKNVQLTMQHIKDRSPVLKGLLDQGEVGMVGGMYDLATGAVQFLYEEVHQPA